MPAAKGSARTPLGPKMADDIWMALELMTNCLSIVHPVCREVVLVLQAFNGEDYHYQEERH